MTPEEQHLSYDSGEGSSNSARTTTINNEGAVSDSNTELELRTLLELDVDPWSSRFAKNDGWYRQQHDEQMALSENVGNITISQQQHQESHQDLLHQSTQQQQSPQEASQSEHRAVLVTVQQQAGGVRVRSRKRTSSQQQQDLAAEYPNSRARTTYTRVGAAPSAMQEQMKRVNILRLREYDVQLQTQEQHRAQLATSTQKSYARWCARKGYGQDFTVRVNKFLLYMTENLALEPYLPDGDPQSPDAVLPLRKNPKTRGSASHIGHDYDLNAEPIAFETADMYVKAACDLYNYQKSLPEMAHEPHPRTPGVTTLMEGYKRRLGLMKTALKLKTLCIDQGEELHNMKAMMKQGWRHNYSTLGGQRNHKIVGLRDRAIASWSYFMMTPRENMRKATLSDIQPVAYGHRTGQGGQYILGVILTMLQEKTNRDGKECMTAIVRNKDVEICPVGSLAFYLFELWQCSEAKEPDFDNDEDWRKRFLWIGSDNSQELSTSAHYEGQARLFGAAGISTDNSTHHHRGAAARHAHNSGCEIKDIEHHAHWNMNRLMSHDLDMAPSVVAIKMAGFTSPGERPWYPRNIKIPPIELQRMIFPFIEKYFANQADWVKRVENIMQDNHLMLGRPPSTLIKVDKESQPLISILTLLAHLCKVVIQDAAALMDIHDDHLSEYGLHRIFQQPLFKHPMFMEYRIAFRRSIATATSPTSDSLLANTPAILTELRGLGTNLEHTIQRTTSNITEECQRGFRSINNAHQRLDGNLTNEINGAAETLSVNIAEELNRVSGSLINLIGGLTYQMHRFLMNAGAGFSTTAQSQPPYNHSYQPHRKGRQQQQQQQRMRQEPRQQDPRQQEPRQQDPQDQELWQQELQDQEPLGQGLQDQEPLDQELIEQPGQQSPPPPTREQQLLELEEALAAPKHGVAMDGIYDMIPQKRDLREHWREWFYGFEGQPSIWRLNKHRGTKWRSVPGKKGNELARRYKFKRDIVFSILEKMLLKPGTLAEREEAALFEMEELLVPVS